MTHIYTTNIPVARVRLRKIAEQLAAAGKRKSAREIIDIVENLMTRRPGPRRAPSTRREVTPSIVKAVKLDLKNTDLPQEEIARKYKIDGGRVSEIYRSMRN